jgi:hypothetical protein
MIPHKKRFSRGNYRQNRTKNSLDILRCKAVRAIPERLLDAKRFQKKESPIGQ